MTRSIFAFSFSNSDGLRLLLARSVSSDIFVFSSCFRLVMAIACGVLFCALFNALARALAAFSSSFSRTASAFTSFGVFHLTTGFLLAPDAPPAFLTSLKPSFTNTNTKESA
uniref:Uncharacterized protein n=1 Tax=Lotharella oceanica TaxID=641309 RepID=A0A7S2TH12_9EUKA